jgi:hypothetical protein
MHAGMTFVPLGPIATYWVPLLLVPPLAWAWHVARAVRGRDYPLLTFALAVLSGIVVFGGLCAVAVIAYPRGYGIEHPFDPVYNDMWETAFDSLLTSYAMVPLELVVALAWYVAREVRRSWNRGHSAPGSTEPSTEAGAPSRLPNRLADPPSSDLLRG